MASGFSFAGVIVRFIIALVLVFLTYNPSGYSYFHWIKEQAFVLPVLVLMGIVMAIVWVIFLRATLRSLGALGIILAVALFACLVWIAIYYQALTLNSQPFIYIVLVVIAAVLAVGMSWSHIRRRISGQADVDDVDE